MKKEVSLSWRKNSSPVKKQPVPTRKVRTSRRSKGFGMGSIGNLLYKIWKVICCLKYRLATAVSMGNLVSEMRQSVTMLSQSVVSSWYRHSISSLLSFSRCFPFSVQPISSAVESIWCRSSAMTCFSIGSSFSLWNTSRAFRRGNFRPNRSLKKEAVLTSRLSGAVNDGIKM